MKLVTIKINNRVEKKLNFDLSQEQFNNHYIIRNCDNPEPHELFRINQNAILVNGQIKTIVTITAIQEDTTNHVLEVFLGEANNRGRTPNFGNMLTSINGYWVYKMSKPKEIDQYELKFHLMLENGFESNISIFVHFATKDTTFDAIIDFGSEASQASWWHQGSPHQINLTESIRRQHGTTIKDMKDEDFVQYEDDTLYKSIYYIKRNLGTYPNYTPWPKYDDDNWKFLASNTTEADEIIKEHMQLPNSKLMQFDISSYTKLCVKENDDFIELKHLGEGIVERKLLNNIVLQVLRTIRNHAKNSNKDAYITLNVLMPNIYPIHITSRKLNQLAKDIIDLIKSEKQNENFFFSNIKAVELRAISESDASMLGYINGITSSKQAITFGNYLIMDAGKGTLDFSIMEASKTGCPFVNKSRAGIVGAGNAITYGLLIGLVNDYLCLTLDGYKDSDNKKKHESIQEFIYKFVFGKGNTTSTTTEENPKNHTEGNAASNAGSSVDVATLRRLFEAVENYKKVYNQLYKDKVYCNTIEPKDEASADIDQLRLDSFIQWIKGLIKNGTNLTQEGKAFVTIEIENIVNEAISKMSDIIDSTKLHPIICVVFTGRGFLMQELQDVMEKRLRDIKIINNATRIKTPGEDNMKKACMRINQLLITNKYDASPSRQTIGLVSPAKEQENSWLSNNPNPKANKENNVAFDEQWINNFGVRPATTSIKTFKGNVESEGVVLDGITNTTRISIGGWLYDVDANFESKKCTLFFDGIQYWITADDVDSQPLGDDFQQDPSDSFLGYESLFPNVNITSMQEVKIPEAMPFDSPQVSKTADSVNQDSMKNGSDPDENTDEIQEIFTDISNDDSHQTFIKKIKAFFQKAKAFFQ